MNVLFVHQNFPGQYKHLAPALAAAGHSVHSLGIHANAPLAGVVSHLYSLGRGNGAGTHAWVTDFESKVVRAEAAAVAAIGLRDQGFTPDVICAHPGWGETMFLKDVWPQARMLTFLEYYYHFTGADVNFDPEFADFSLGAAARLRTKNANALLALEAMDAGVSPTFWQRQQFPVRDRDHISVIHDGVDTAYMAPNPLASIQSPQAGIDLKAGDEVVTFVSRNLEPCRGFHIFMRALPQILQSRPNARVIVIGGDETGYGAAAPAGKTWRQVMLEELGTRLDLTRVHFVGKVSYEVFRAFLQVSAAHVYLTYPFVLSWSLLEAMSAGCLVVGSKTPPVEEVIEHQRNGLLVDFFDSGALASSVVGALEKPREFDDIRKAARQTIVERYDNRSICLPQHIALVERVFAGKTA